MKISITQAVERLLKGDVVAVPSETVYGLAAMINQPAGIEKIFTVKQRPHDHPLIVHISEPEHLQHYCTHLPPYVDRLITQFWPGPLTLVANKTAAISAAITANQPTVAIRCPAHPMMADIIKQCGHPVVAPSANRYCQTSPTTPEHVEQGLGQTMAVVDGDPCQVGIESTIILVTETDQITLLRPGIITAEQIATVAGVPVQQQIAPIKISGNKANHYQPTKPITLFNDIEQLSTSPSALCLLLTADTVSSLKHTVQLMPQQPVVYAKQLYQLWHQADSMNVTEIWVEQPPLTSDWQGINDRIIRATTTNLCNS